MQELAPVDLQRLIQDIARTLVENEESVSVRPVEGEKAIVYELRTHPDDTGKVIGQGGQTARFIRILLKSAGIKRKKRIDLEIIE